jgi:5-methylcytosine-specific restriction endonuclease McrA
MRRVDLAELCNETIPSLLDLLTEIDTHSHNKFDYFRMTAKEDHWAAKWVPEITQCIAYLEQRHTTPLQYRDPNFYRQTLSQLTSTPTSMTRPATVTKPTATLPLHPDTSVSVPVPVAVAIPCCDASYCTHSAVITQVASTQPIEVTMPMVTTTVTTVPMVTTPPMVTTTVTTVPVAANDHHNSDVKPSTTASKRTRKANRHLVWNKYIGADLFQHNCFCCKRNRITVTDYESGHVQSVATGGSDELDNLRPICRQCNRSMGTMHMRDYVLQYGLLF